PFCHSHSDPSATRLTVGSTSATASSAMRRCTLVFLPGGVVTSVSWLRCGPRLAVRWGPHALRATSYSKSSPNVIGGGWTGGTCRAGRARRLRLHSLGYSLG